MPSECCHESATLPMHSPFSPALVVPNNWCLREERKELGETLPETAENNAEMFHAEVEKENIPMRRYRRRMS
jgi:hypothetical protein